MSPEPAGVQAHEGGEGREWVLRGDDIIVLDVVGCEGPVVCPGTMPRRLLKEGGV